MGFSARRRFRVICRLPGMHTPQRVFMRRTFSVGRTPPSTPTIICPAATYGTMLPATPITASSTDSA